MCLKSGDLKGSWVNKVKTEGNKIFLDLIYLVFGASVQLSNEICLKFKGHFDYFYINITCRAQNQPILCVSDTLLLLKRKLLIDSALRLNARL